MSALRFAGVMAFTVIPLSALLFAQSKPAVSNPSAAQEFPVTMRQNVVAGTTPVGTKVEAKLTIATLVDGNVIPIDATFVGEVVESVAKSATAPSRLAIRMDSVRWKKGTAAVRVYLTSWYYPLRLATREERPHDPNGIHGDVTMQTGGRPAAPASRPLPPGSVPNGDDIPPGPTSTLSDHRVVMKDIDSVRLDDGTLALTSTHSNIKLDKTKTYVFATGNLAAPPAN
jgi:hypothetical protein